MENRTILAIVLSLILLIGYQYFFLKKQPQQPGEPEQQIEQTVAETTANDENSAAVQEDETTFRTPLAVTQDDRNEGEQIVVKSPLYTATFSTRGASLASFTLNNYRQAINDNAMPIELVSIGNDMEYPLSVTFPGSSIAVPVDVIYTADEDSLDLTDTVNTKQLIFSWTYPGEITIEKVYTFFPEKYTFDLDVRVRNLSDNTLKQNALLSWNHYFDPEVKTDRYSHQGPVAFVKDKFVSEKIKKLDEKKFLGPDVSWGGYENKYFIASMIAEQPSLTSLIMAKNANNIVSTSLEGPRNIIPPGQLGSFKYSLYLGPKDYDLLKAEDVGLENSINFGSWIKWLALPLLKGLKFIYNYVHNYGVAIIILTILVKILTWPLGNMSYKSMKEMQKLQPKIKDLQEKFKDDKAKIQQATMELYKKHKVNPMGGCFPIVIQIPIFFALYRALLYSIELRHSPFLFWIQDLSAKDPYYVTPIIMGATMFLQQKMSPAPGGNEMQAKMMMWMPVIFTFLFLNFPSGLVIYWLFNNILSIGQQYYINKQKT